MEQLNCIQILEVRNTAKSATPGNDKANGPEKIPDVLVRIRVMEKHDVEITLRSSPEKSGGMRVADAKFLTPTVVRAPVDTTAAGTDENEEEAEKKVLKLTIPPLNDLVRLCGMFPQGEDLRFLVRETMARIRMIEARVVELAVLHNNVLTKIGTFHHDNEGFGGEEQEVVCSLNECITVVLRLTADCPNVPGSVYISQMVGVGGWDDATVKNIQDTVAAQEFRTPLAVIQAIQSEISRLEKEGLSLPKTPMLSLRRKKT